MTSNATSTSTQASGNIPPASPVIESPQLRDDLVASLVLEVLSLHRKYDDLLERFAAMSTEIVTGSIVVRDDAGLMSTRIDAGSIHIEHSRNGTAVGSFVSISANPGSAEVQIGADLSARPGDPNGHGDDACRWRDGACVVHRRELHRVRSDQRRIMRKVIASITIAVIGITAGATTSSALTSASHCGKGIADVPASWGWQFAEHAPVSTKFGNVSVWTNRHGKIVGYAAYEDTNVMPSANCAAKDL